MVNSQENIKSFLRETVYVGQLDHSLNLSKNSLPAAISQESMLSFLHIHGDKTKG